MSAPPATQPPTKNQMIDLVLLALGSSHEGLKALRGVLASDPRFSVLDAAVDLDPVWQVLEAQPDFERGAATAAMCYVKGLEGRLGLNLRLPEALVKLSPAEQVQQAARCRVKREEVERVLEGRDLPPRIGTSTQPVAVPSPERPVRRIVGIAATLVAAACIVFLVYTIGGEMEHAPKYRRIDAAEFAGDIPIGSARVWGTEVRAQLVDGSWMRQPEARRRRQLESALERLAPRQLTTLIVEDDAKRPQAVAQTFARSHRVQIRFY